MAWVVEVAETAEKQLAHLNPSIQRRIFRFLRERIATDEDPRRIGKALHGSRRGLWRYRVGDYRLICDIQGDRLRVLVLTVGHRREVYR